MVRDAAGTRRRILDAAIAEFSAYGIAGARIDRVAEASGSNKAMIYKYFGNKSQLFDAVFDAIVVQTVDAVPIDGDDLPEYVVRLWDRHRAHPEPQRVGLWDELERSSEGMRAEAVVAAARVKVATIDDAQRRGVVSAGIAPQELLDLLLALSRSGLARPISDEDADRYRDALRMAARKLIQPG
ncbi:TetR/AcrR family transcriptional regulator [Kineosporia sp. NBRC 101731]|uniref:TetR/AcrR family transcriptional regulator n=1 Tax=Kineosporia sp. NBRC 101731 TaxID=3032199 RepID=UPI00249FEB29|nr:TetR/AcrR family transcriptional regulator [Kineosporia sp. NBRC 101731]GLY28817.1 TetR family transcriptional regulator [Kineosporia sp. NBRC 101731]